MFMKKKRVEFDKYFSWKQTGESENQFARKSGDGQIKKGHVRKISTSKCLL